MTLTATNDFAGRLAILLTYNAQTALVKTVTWINARRWRESSSGPTSSSKHG